MHIAAPLAMDVTDCSASGPVYARGGSTESWCPHLNIFGKSGGLWLQYTTDSKYPSPLLPFSLLTGLFLQYDPLYTYGAFAWPLGASAENTGTTYNQSYPIAEQQPSVTVNKKSFPCSYESCQNTYTTMYRLKSLSCLSSMYTLRMPAEVKPTSTHQRKARRY